MRGRISRTLLTVIVLVSLLALMLTSCDREWPPAPYPHPVAYFSAVAYA